MLDDDLRTRLAAYAEHEPDDPGVAELMGRADGRRRRRVAGVMGAVAVVAAAAVWLPSQWVAPLPATPAPAAPVPTASGQAGTPTPSALPTPGRLTPSPRPTGTPTASCSEIRSAWTKALTATEPRPAGLPRNAVVRRESGEAVFVERWVDNGRRYRLYPQGLGGTFVDLPRSEETSLWFAPGAHEGRLALLEMGVSTYGRDSVMLSVVEPGASTLRRVATYTFDHNLGGVALPAAMHGSVLQWVEVHKPGTRGSGEAVIWELDLGRAGAEPMQRKRFAVVAGEFSLELGVHLEYITFLDPDHGWVLMDRATLETFQLSNDVDPPGSDGRAGDPFTVLQVRSGSDPAGIYAVDTITREARRVMDGDMRQGSVDGELILLQSMRGVWHVVDLTTARVVALPGLKENATYGLSGGKAWRLDDVVTGDLGVSVPVQSLPTVFPEC